VSARKITGVVFFEETVNSFYCIELIMTPFFRELTAEGTVQLFHAVQCHVPHSRLVSDCPFRGIQRIVDNLQITAS
jgi:hypothetical protein